MDNSTLFLVIALLVVGGFLMMALVRSQRTRRLKERFGPEYERTLQELGDKRLAERELEERISYLKILKIRPLTAEEVNRYSLVWEETQREFVDEPLNALQKADRLIQEVMKKRGYPVEDFEQRADLLSVEYPELVTDYRGMHQISIKEDQANTEEMRQAMIHGRALFQNLIKQEPRKEEFDQKEKI